MKTHGEEIAKAIAASQPTFNMDKKVYFVNHQSFGGVCYTTKLTAIQKVVPEVDAVLRKYPNLCH